MRGSDRMYPLIPAISTPLQGRVEINFGGAPFRSFTATPDVNMGERSTLNPAYMGPSDVVHVM